MVGPRAHARFQGLGIVGRRHGQWETLARWRKRARGAVIGGWVVTGRADMGAASGFQSVGRVVCRDGVGAVSDARIWRVGRELGRWFGGSW